MLYWLLRKLLFTNFIVFLSQGYEFWWVGYTMTNVRCNSFGGSFVYRFFQEFVLRAVFLDIEL